MTNKIENENKKNRHSVLDTESHELEEQLTDAESSLPAAGRCSMTKEKESETTKRTVILNLIQDLMNKN